MLGCVAVAVLLVLGGCVMATSRTSRIKQGFDYELGGGPTVFQSAQITNLDPVESESVSALGLYGNFRETYGFNEHIGVEVSGTAWLGWALHRQVQAQSAYGWVQPAVGVKLRPWSTNHLLFLEYRYFDLGLGWTFGVPSETDERFSSTIELFEPVGYTVAWGYEYLPYLLGVNVAWNLCPGSVRLSPNIGGTLALNWAEHKVTPGGLLLGLTYSPR
jgi:hypothetical protein